MRTQAISSRRTRKDYLNHADKCNEALESRALSPERTFAQGTAKAAGFVPCIVNTLAAAGLPLGFAAMNRLAAVARVGLTFWQCVVACYSL